MTNQPTREALAFVAGMELIHISDVLRNGKLSAHVLFPTASANDLHRNIAALSILSTALAERDARIAELEGALIEIDDLRGGPAICPEFYQAKAIATRARLKLGKESSHG